MSVFFNDDEFKCIDIPLSLSYNSSNELLKDIQCGNQLVGTIESTSSQKKAK